MATRETAAQKREREAREAEEARIASEAEGAETGNGDDGGEWDNPDEAERGENADSSDDDGQIAVGFALTERQTVGLDPQNFERQADEATRRDEFPNLQTTHESEFAIDPTSGTATPGIAISSGQENASPSPKRRQHGVSDEDRSGMSDMNGRPPMPHPANRAAMSDAESFAMEKLGKSKNPLSPQEIGVPKSVMDNLVARGDVVAEPALGGMFFPDTGTRYRRK